MPNSNNEPPLREGCGCKLCKTPFRYRNLSDEEKRLRRLAQEDYRRDAWALIKEQQLRNGALD